MNRFLHYVAVFTASLLLAGCTAGLGSEVTTEPDVITGTEESAVDTAIAAAEARSVNYTLGETSDSPTDVDMEAYQAANRADALREAVGLEEQKDAYWKITYMDAETSARLFSDSAGRSYYDCLYAIHELEGRGVPYKFMWIIMDSVTGAVRSADMYWPDGQDSLDFQKDVDYEAVAQAGREWMASEELPQQMMDFAAALGYHCVSYEPIGTVILPQAHETSVSLGVADYLLTTDDGRQLHIINETVACKPTALHLQSAAAIEATTKSYSELASSNGWYEQDENGNWYHVDAGGQPDGNPPTELAPSNGWYEEDENGNWYHVDADGQPDGNTTGERSAP